MAAFIACSSLLLSSSAMAENVNTGYFNNTAVKGYDVVSYFTDAKPAKGRKTFKTEYQGAEYYFSSAKNLTVFKESPAKYAPQYGGYCAWAVSQGYTAGIDPEAWKVVDDKLYLNYSKSIQAKWEKDIPKFIADANVNWPALNK